MRNIINIANGITIIRILLIPWLIVSYTRGSFFTAGLIITTMCLSDFFDGRIARAMGTAGPLGALLDVGADCALVFIFQGVLMLNNDWPLHIFICSLLSVITFIIGRLIQGKAKQGRVGRYSGGVIMCLFFIRVIHKYPLPILLIRCTRVVELIAILILTLSIIENIAFIPPASPSYPGEIFSYEKD